MPEDKDLGIRPETKLREIGETDFIRQYQCPVRSLAAFEKSEHPDDWRDLMRLYLVRRTRSFIQNNYTDCEEATGRRYLTYEDGSRAYFPVRTPRTVKFAINDQDPRDPYGQLSSPPVVRTVDKLNLPRYGLGNYVSPAPKEEPTQAEAKVLSGLSRAGKRLMGFCRTNLFKRLESGGPAFIQSVERHTLRNFIFLHAIENNLALPIGSQGAELLDARYSDADEIDTATRDLFEDDGDQAQLEEAAFLRTEEDYRRRAAVVYADYADRYQRRFKWVRPELFTKKLRDALGADATALLKVLENFGAWETDKDTKLGALFDLLTRRHPSVKILVFTQFADTVRYLSTQLRSLGVTALAGVTGDSADPTDLAWRFSPISNNKRGRISPDDELRVLIATDVLSEGQNLQDAHIVVNYDLPWAIIRLIQRAGRVDRIGQTAEEITCYSFLPADGVDRIINLRSRVVQRLRENAEVVGADEAFFEDEAATQPLIDLYHEKSGILDGEGRYGSDLASYAYKSGRMPLTASRS